MGGNISLIQSGARTFRYNKNRELVSFVDLVGFPDFIRALNKSAIENERNPLEIRTHTCMPREHLVPSRGYPLIGYGLGQVRWMVSDGLFSGVDYEMPVFLGCSYVFWFTTDLVNGQEVYSLQTTYKMDGVRKLAKQVGAVGLVFRPGWQLHKRKGGRPKVS